MSDGLTAAPPHPAAPLPPEPGRRPTWAVVLVQVVAVLVVFAALGAAGGWLWYTLWSPPSGVVSGGEWYTSEHGLREQFSGVALFVVIGVAAGVVLGALAAWRLDRSELATLAAVVVGSTLAAWLALRVGAHLSPADPHRLAETAADGTRLKGHLTVDAWAPRGAWTFGGLLGVALVYAGSLGRGSRPEDPRG